MQIVIQYRLATKFGISTECYPVFAGLRLRLRQQSTYQILLVLYVSACGCSKKKVNKYSSRCFPVIANLQSVQAAAVGVKNNLKCSVHCHPPPPSSIAETFLSFYIHRTEIALPAMAMLGTSTGTASSRKGCGDVGCNKDRFPKEDSKPTASGYYW